MIDWFAHVRIKETGITGIVVDIHTVKGIERFEVESDEKGRPAASVTMIAGNCTVVWNLNLRSSKNERSRLMSVNPLL